MVSEQLDFEVAQVTPVFAADRSTLVGRVRPGTRYEAAGSDGEWITLAAPDGGVGYIRRSDVELIPAQKAAPAPHQTAASPAGPADTSEARPNVPPASPPKPSTTSSGGTTARPASSGRASAPPKPQLSVPKRSRWPDVVAWLVATAAVFILFVQYRSNTYAVDDELLLSIALAAQAVLGVRLLSKTPG